MHYNDTYSSKESRGSGALEISMHSRKIAREQGILLAGYKTQAAQPKSGPARWSLAQLLASLRLF